jgi:hypothetical protein
MEKINTLTEKLFNAIFLCALLSTIACGSSDEDDGDKSNTENEQGVVRVVNGSSGSGSGIVDIPVVMQTSSGGSAGFGLISNPSFVIELDGCISGYSATVNEATPTLKVYRFDRNCKAKLVELVIDGHTLVPTIADPFTNWDANDTATFDEVGEAGTFAVSVVVVSQLSNPVTGAETIEYQIRNVIGGGDFTGYVPAITLSGATCCTTNPLKANGVELTFTWSLLTSRYDQVIVRRSAGVTPPSALDCSNGSLVTTYSSFTSGDTVVYTDDTGSADQVFSYRACVLDTASQVIESATISNKSSANIQWMFTTSTTFASGGFGLATANSSCQTLGNVIDSSLTWKALLSDSTMEAAGRIPISGTVYNRNITPQIISTTYTGFWGATLSATPHFDQNGVSRVGSAWTGTINGGDRSTTNCANWTNNTAGVTATRGTTNSTTQRLSAGTSACNNTTRRGYCVSNAVNPLVEFSAATPGSGTDGDIALTVTFPADTTGWTKLDIRRSLGATAPSSTCSTGTLVKSYTGPVFTSEILTDTTGRPGAYYRYVACIYKGATIVSKATTFNAARAYNATASHAIFVTSVATYRGAQAGFTNMDTACQTAGNVLKPGKTWRAVASTGTVAANSAGRIAATTDIRNINGDLVASSAADLFDGTITNPIRYTEFGIDATTAQVWTGATSTGGSAADHCTNWTSSATGVRATYGIANASGDTWLTNTSVACNAQKRFYCFATTAD